LRLISALLLVATICEPAFAADRYAPVRDALNAGRADDAMALLGTDADPEAANLRCRVQYSEEHWDQAVQACEAAVGGGPTNSNYHLWLGRAYGEKADHASFLTAYDLAKRAVHEFEAAVQFDKKNLEALSDLGEFYAEAPSIVGGGRDKARKIASTLRGLDLARYHMLMARIAEREHDYAAADNEIRAAIHAAPDPYERWFDLASFYRRRARWSEMTDAIHQGEATDVHHGAPLLDAAQTLRRSGRELDLAAALTRKYLTGGHLAEESPAFHAHWLLGDLLEMRGEHTAAQAEYAAAVALAKNYRPASK
jgi:tetratricopeptide (TPR) repeat protein